MGVAGFYRWLVQRYPLIRQRANRLSYPRINNFYIDFNCIIYNSIRLVKPSLDGDNTVLFNEICRYVDLLVQTIKPESLLFIAVDGPAPLAKCAQQRSRRFVAARDHEDGTFSTAAISVGTEFMEELHEHLLKFINSRIENDPIWSQPKVIYSSHRTPGEGENKFFNYMREHMFTEEHDEFATHCIYSPDADLVFLALQTGLKNIYLMREWGSWMGPNEDVANGEIDKLRVSPGDFELLHLPLLRDYFQKEFPESDLPRLINDFVAISFLIGNDFIPHFPEIDIHNGDFDNILTAYRLSLLDRKKYLITEEITYDKENLLAFLKAVVANVRSKARPSGKPAKTKHAKSTELHTKEGARSYLKSKYKSGFNKEFEEELCHSVIDSFNWVLKYYFEGCPDYTWQFHYFYPPPLVLVAEYVLDYEPNFEQGRPPLPFEQLLSILPPKMSYLLPYPIASLMFSPSPLAEYYPDKFEIDLNGRKYEYEGVTLIPFVDMEKIRTETSRVFGALSPKEKKRNEFDELKIMNPGKPQTKLTKDPPGLPTLNGIFQYDYENSSNELAIFGKPSRYPSMFIVPDFEEVGENEKYKDLETAKQLIGKIVLCNWPTLIPGKVMGCFNNKDCFVVDSRSPGNLLTCGGAKKMENLISNLKRTKGLDCEKCTVGLIVQPYAIKSINGSVIKSDEEFLFPAELIVTDTVETMKRYLTPEPPKLPEVGSRVIIIEGADQGKVAKVTSVDQGTGYITAKLILSTPFDGSFLRNDSYPLSINELATDLELKPEVVSCMLSTVKVLNFQGDVRVPDVALTLSYRDLVMDGIAQKQRDGSIMYSRSVLNICKEYLENTGLADFYSKKAKIQTSEKGRPKLTIFGDTLAGKPEKAPAKIEEIQNWIHNQSEVAGLFLIDTSISIVTRTSSTMLEVRLDKLKFEETEGSEVTLNPKQFIVRGGYPASRSKISIGDRVTSIAPNGPVPFGTHGTVIGFNYQTHDVYVVADTPFDLGSTLRMRLNSQRGFVACQNDLILYYN
ncbi:XRN 5'-3' exonuclease N-terminus family protein [Trichomonas vaginalis G3]|uniref:XRN 5'-3' exonuclease N-terminus family protein n=1 Tax=Trichomonas vaginalis (strain ATCC PRA-98 / G3) TaxID=412133 RepID=A2DQZ7_TRIV3|nr:5'->3' exoribonuclease family [Trichomonas vaginalis G3]EAY17096.1 XRN 5'-3' exonuclease N-terminus family protein [Trichomonas vaginalis G3]KAI5508800.1 5'->3' exoribonuclease family [Trichomonas vaginalis G3]|eukprot:XP_001329319.1 XRN 5'-3' exonuclease N-terminus family protein [Trichomonas vaginalis G3]